MNNPPRHQMVRRRVTILAAMAVVVATSFAAGATVQRIEGQLATVDRCNSTRDAIACVITLDDMDVVEPPRRTPAAGGENG